MQKRKGFTLVELVIVIAVIAILAGVLIGTFASVLSKAQETAKLQQIKADEHDQKANDLLKKIEDSNWYGWEDFETSIVEKITNAIKNEKPGEVNVQLDSAVVSKAVSEAMTKYYAEHAMGNTSLTEEQVKAIVENALGSFKFEAVTKAQVETIVNTAVGKMTTGLTAAQVQKIVNAAADRVEAGQLTSAQITTLVGNAIATEIQSKNLATSAEVKEAIDKVVDAIKTKEVSTLTSKEVETIINAAVAKSGTTAWVTPTTYETAATFTLESETDVQGLATLVNAGYDFEGKTVELPATVDLSKVGDWTPIGNTRDSEFKGTIGGETQTIIDGLTLTEQFNAVKNGYLLDCSSSGNMDKVGVGFVAYLGKGATLKNIKFTNVKINISDKTMDGICVGVAVGYLDGGTIDNVDVESGYVKNYYRVGSLVGATSGGTIKNCEVGTSTKGVLVESTGGVNSENKGGYGSVGGLVGYYRNFAAATKETVAGENLVIDNVTVYATLVVKAGTGNYANKVFGQVEALYSVNGTALTEKEKGVNNKFTSTPGYTFTEVAYAE